jgi:cysteine desulfurase
MNRRSYLDFNATAPLRPEVREAIAAAFGLIGNPSSVHAEGRAARAAIETARRQVAGLVGARPDQVVFTSGGTEANALALAQAKGAVHASAVEHASVRANVRLSAENTEIPVDSAGVVDLDALAALAADAHLPNEARPLFSVMAANNETGAVQPVADAAEIAHGAGALLHCDAVQAAGKLPIDFTAAGADLMSLSAHKIGGPKGIGALIVRDGLPVTPLIKGGAHETRRRAGTENVPGIVGFGVAAGLASAELADGRTNERLSVSRDRLEREAVAAVPDAVIFSAQAVRLPNTTLIGVPGGSAETLVIGLDLAGVAVSSGAACSSGKVEASHVLAAMGVDAQIARSAIRVSLGWNTAEADIDRFLSAWSALVARTRKTRAAA